MLSRWLSFSLLAAGGFSLMAIFVKYATLSAKPAHVLFYLFLITTIFFFVHLKKTGKLSLPSKEKMWPIVAISLLSFGANLFVVFAYTTAPNIGYVDAITSSRILLLSALSPFLFHAKLRTQGIIGATAIFLGMLILML